MKRFSAYSQYLGPFLCVAGGVLLYLILVLAGGEDDAAAKGALPRSDYGGNTEEYRICVEGLTDAEIPITVPVNPRVYTQDEAEKVFFSAMDQMESLILNGNESLSEVRGSLSLPARMDGTGVSISWSSSDTDIMDDTGLLGEEVSDPTELILTAVLSADVGTNDGEINTFRGKFEMPLVIMPPERTAEEKTLAKFMAEVENEEEKGRTEGEFILPSQFEGRRLSYRSEGGTDYRMIPLIGILLAALILAHRQNQGNEDRKKREKELSLDYSDMLSKFVVLTGAGLTVRNVWERIVRDYEEAKRSGEQKERAVYEEMRQTSLQMQNGVSEQEAYRNFGRRCGLSSYLKFSSLLEQNCRSGTKNLREILQTEMNDALEERKNIARRLGEEAGTKLLLPLFLLLGIVMAVIMVPALMMMG